jgi:acetyl-CoA acetyltransferase
MSGKVYVVSVGHNKFGKNFDESVKSMTGESLKLALKDSDLKKKDIQAAWFSNSTWGAAQFQHCIRGEVALSAHGLDEIPIINVENACASGSTAFHSAWMSVKGGLYDCALAIGTEKMYFQSAPLGSPTGIRGIKGPMNVFISGTDVEKTVSTIATLKKKIQEGNKEAAQKSGKEGSGGKKNHSVFMDFYAMGARKHMKTHGTTQRQIAVIAAKNHNNSTMNPLAQYTFPQTVEQVMNDYVVAYPLTRAMCAPIGDGSAAAILCSEKFLQQNPRLKDRAVVILASILRSGSLKSATISNRAITAAYNMAGITPRDVNVAEVHDATAYAELNVTERLGFCPVGEGGPFVESGATELDGEIPINPSGGLLARGHPIGASGLAQMHELVTQLRGEAGKRQVKDPEIALAHNGGGTIGSGEAALCIHILGRK